jgi:hypothetical protein
MWVEGTVGGKYIRHSLNTKSWERAAGRCREMEAADDPRPKEQVMPAITIEAAMDAYLKDARARGLGEATLAKLETIFRKQMLVWAKSGRFTRLADLNRVAMRDFCSTWKD